MGGTISYRQTREARLPQLHAPAIAAAAVTSRWASWRCRFIILTHWSDKSTLEETNPLIPTLTATSSRDYSFSLNWTKSSLYKKVFFLRVTSKSSSQNNDELLKMTGFYVFFVIISNLWAPCRDRHIIFKHRQFFSLNSCRYPSGSSSESDGPWLSFSTGRYLRDNNLYLRNIIPQLHWACSALACILSGPK